MGSSFVQEVAEVEQGVSRRQELKESLQERTNTQGLVLCQALNDKYGEMVNLAKARKLVTLVHVVVNECTVEKSNSMESHDL